MIEKMSLGTAQFGLNYGINNSRGKINLNETKEILNLALKKGVKNLDTASIYGNSEEVIGLSNLGRNFNIYTKIPPKVTSISSEISQSIKKLNVDKLYGCFFHDINDFKNNEKLLAELNLQKINGAIQKIGFSVYFPEDIEFLFDKKVFFDIIQFPYNIFDRRFEYLFPILTEKNIEINVRSIFLQGLFFKSMESLNTHFNPILEKLSEINKISKDANIPLPTLLINFVLSNQYIQKLVLGIDGISDLKENILIFKNFMPNNKIHNMLNNFKEDNTEILLPYLWR